MKGNGRKPVFWTKKQPEPARGWIHLNQQGVPMADAPTNARNAGSAQ